jgi:hypothetical protein
MGIRHLPRWISFNGAADLHPRKWYSSVSTRITCACFNGAADLHPRKCFRGNCFFFHHFHSHPIGISIKTRKKVVGMAL